MAEALKLRESQHEPTVTANTETLTPKDNQHIPYPMETKYLMETTYPMETVHKRQPLRYLNPEVAQSIGEAKNRTGMSWRHIARLTGVSHPYLVLLAQGRRVPSLHTAGPVPSSLRR